MVTHRFFRQDEGRTLPTDLAFKNTVILINQHFWNIFRSEVMAITGENGPLLLFQLGQSVGFAFGAQMKSYTDDSKLENGLTITFEYMFQAGWGTFDSLPLQLTENNRLDLAEVRVYDNFFAIGRKKTDAPSCFLVSGILAGIAEGLFDEAHDCHETKCVACGDEYCEFRISRTNPT